MSLISLEGMEFYAHHGCFKEEKVIGTRFIIDFFLEADTTEAEKTDDLTKTINYQTVYALVKEEMDQASNLLEHVARQILDRVCRQFPQITFAEVTVSKINPQVGGKVEKVSVTLSTED
ncbi:MAG: dihydroneopterin aldolase [Bacteroidetes bacterium]|nr:dihydroneopterin aldolase [Bacteroidota bacterium]